ncbi:hypothetical protein PIB30_077220 [Stylosanthes scabra]|uniref:Uncharacterized protein n=1 Tax=Stylosanthes scabra TaxID=79078 RepID=A0ABU6TR50_9FABA|nr:hypothetical protein [Stylosanthes scabra]
MALFFDDLGLGGWSVTLPPLGSLRLLGQACEFMTHSLAFFRVVLSTSGDLMHARRRKVMIFLMGCGFQDFCNRPIIPLPPEFPEACLRRLGGLKGLFFTFSHFCYSSLSSEFSLSKISFFRWCSSPLVERLFIFRNGEEKSCQNVGNPCVLSPAERELYGWVDAEVFMQSSVLASEHLPEHCRKMRLAQDLASERDYVLEAAGPSDRLPFRVLEDRTHFLWVYVELFMHLGVRLPFSDFQREVLTRCQVAASQLHLNGWGFLRTFERVYLHFGFLLPLPGTRPFWVDDEGKPYP